MKVAKNLVIIKDHKFKRSVVKIRNKKHSSKDVLADLMALDMLASQLVLIHVLRLQVVESDIVQLVAVVQHSDSLSGVIGEYDRDDVRLSVYVMPVSHVDEVVLIVFESNGCSFLELLWVIDVDEVVVLHLLVAWVAGIALRLCLVVDGIGRTFSFDAGHTQMTCFWLRVLDLFALAALLNVCPGNLPLRSMAACSHL
jgi:hypothetical protein